MAVLLLKFEDFNSVDIICLLVW